MNVSYIFPSLFLAVAALFVMGAVLPLLLKDARRATISAFVPAAIASALTVALSILVLSSGAVVRFSSPLAVPVPSIGITFYIDGIAAFFMLIVGLVAATVSVYSLGYSSAHGGKYGGKSIGFLLNLFVLSMILVTATNNVFSDGQAISCTHPNCLSCLPDSPSTPSNLPSRLSL